MLCKCGKERMNFDFVVKIGKSFLQQWRKAVPCLYREQGGSVSRFTVMASPNTDLIRKMTNLLVCGAGSRPLPLTA